MWIKFAMTGPLALTGLLMVSCEKSNTVTVAREEAFESPLVVSKAAKGSNDREPIPNTTPPGSKMDPSSNAYIIFDGSGSMTGSPIAEARRAVTSFIQGAPDDLNIGLFVFDRNNLAGAELVPLGRGDDQRAELKKKIAGVQAGGSTPLGAAIKAGTKSLIDQFQKQLRYGDIRLIVVTDGQASDGSAFNQSIVMARDYHVPIYTIGFRIRNEHPLRRYSENYMTAQDEQELLDAMKETLAELDDSADL
ncbi:VonWillebr and factor type A domain-containing protein [Haloferula helveola]|uniref:vonWillebr and factor type A domain-containing protein n=1 Tax=Haloferula helveola TaxID=490095 RepID=A0ABM7RGK5_9BACT|nr:VonWillebr and factor type A domain-containing protein [Haloferula helveola]